MFIGAQTCPLVYVLQEKILPDPSRPLLLIDMCYLKVHNLIKEEWAAFLSYTHTPYKDGNNASVFEFLEEALRLRASSMNPIIVVAPAAEMELVNE